MVVTATVTPGGRKRGRPRKKRKAEIEEKEVEDGGDQDAEGGEVEEELDAAWKMVEGTHSSGDFTPFIALFYFGMRVHGGKEEEQAALTVTADVFRLDESQILEHLSEFEEMKNKAKRRRKGRK